MTGTPALDHVFLSLREAYRVIRRRGYLLIGFIDRVSPLGRAYEAPKDPLRHHAASHDIMKAYTDRRRLFQVNTPIPAINSEIS